MLSLEYSFDYRGRGYRLGHRVWDLDPAKAAAL
jgi:hypothetical protein